MHCASRMRFHVSPASVASPISLAFDDLVSALVALECEWTCDHERASLRYTAGDIRHHMCAALAFLEASPATTYEGLNGESKILAHEAFLSVLALGQLLLRAIEEQLAPAVAIAQAQCAVDVVLDLFVPLVSRADEALRRVLLEDVSIEEALREVSRGD